MAVLLAGEPDRRRINDGREAFEVLHHQPVEQDLIAVQQRDQPDILFQRVVLREDMLQLHRHLLLDGEHGRRQQPFHPQLPALGLREGDIFVLGRVAEDLFAARPAGAKRCFVAHGKRIFNLLPNLYPSLYPC